MALKSPEESAKIRSRLLQVSLQEYARLGVNSISLKTLAQQAGVTHGAFYWHFKNRDALMYALADQYRLAFDVHYLNNLQAVEQNALKALKNFLLEVAEHIRSHPEQRAAFRLFYQRSSELPDSTELKQLFDDEHQYRCDCIDRYLKQARKQKLMPKKLKAEPVASVILCNLFGVLDYICRTSLSDEEARAHLKLSIKLMLGGLAAN